jgi:hypothetical protein
MSDLVKLVLPLALVLSGVSCSLRNAGEAPVLGHGEVAGHVVFGVEVFTFTPCGTQEPLWIHGPRSVTDVLKQRQYELTSDVYEPYYAILRGSVGPQLDCGFCEDYEGSFEAKRVIFTRQAQEEDCR